MKEINNMYLPELKLIKKEIDDKIYELNQQKASSINLIFELTMPNVGSWNGKWSGSNNKYTIKRKVNRKITAMLINKSFYYNFGDGWGANVKVTIAKNREKTSNKFCGYQWMIDSILKNGKIITNNKRLI